MKGASAANTSLVGKYLSKKSCRQQHRVLFPSLWMGVPQFVTFMPGTLLSSQLSITLHGCRVPSTIWPGACQLRAPQASSRKLSSTHCPNVPGMAHRQSGAGSNVKIEGHEHLVTALSSLYRAGHSMSNSFVDLQPDDDVQCTGAYCFMGSYISWQDTSELRCCGDDEDCRLQTL